MKIPELFKSMDCLHTMVKIIPHCETSFEKLSAGVPPSFLRGSPREMVRLEYMRLGAVLRARCLWRLLAMARPMEPRPN